MGITDVVTGEQNYTEGDVKEIARAFTGWTISPPARTDPNRFNFQFVVDPNQHDSALKTVYGQTANFSGEDIVALISARRSTARFIARKFFEFFAYPLSASSTDRATIEKFADVYVASDHSIRAMGGRLFPREGSFSGGPWSSSWNSQWKWL